jgi:hypothetical protein
MTYISTRFLFDSLEAAVEALLITLEDARETVYEYSFGSLSADQVYASGLSIIGEAEEIARKLEQVNGATRYDD